MNVRFNCECSVFLVVPSKNLALNHLGLSEVAIRSMFEQ